MRSRAGKASEFKNAGVWPLFKEKWPAILGAIAIGLAVALIGRSWFSGPHPPGAEETVASAADASAAVEPAPISSQDRSLADDASGSAVLPADDWAEAASGWQLGEVPDQPAVSDAIPIVSVSSRENTTGTGAWLTGEIEEIAEDPPLANAARLLDDLPVRR